MLRDKVNHAIGVTAYAYAAMETMGDRIRFLRQSRNLTQEQMGKIVDVSGASISQWESGTITGIRPDNFLRFCAYFGVDPYWVVFGPENERKNPLERSQVSAKPR